MRTNNCFCVICDKPMYRRPNELLKYRHVACIAHRAEAQKLSGITDKQLNALTLGREKGTNHRDGYSHKQESKDKMSVSHIKWCEENPELLAARGKKIRGDLHYRWNGGTTEINKSVRMLSENRKWSDSVKERDIVCVCCGGSNELESHHTIPLAKLIEDLNITSTEDARNHASILWDLNNGVTLCRKCHYLEHGRNFDEN